ncbi:hypothetical protein PMAYCL1PPCAC_25382, partial [Pristionchus mayeri]
AFCKICIRARSISPLYEVMFPRLCSPSILLLLLTAGSIHAALTSFTAVTLAECNAIFGIAPAYNIICSGSIAETATDITCPPNNCLFITGSAGLNRMMNVRTIKKDPATLKWKIDGDAIGHYEKHVGKPYKFGCSTWCL